MREEQKICPGLVGNGIPWHPKNQGNLASSIHCSPNVALCRQWWPGPACPCCHLMAGHRGGLAPQQQGIFHHKQGDCGTDGTFPLFPPWETKGSYFKILSLFQRVGGPEEAKASPKHRIKTQTRCSGGAGAAGHCAAPCTLWEKHTGVAPRTPRDKMTR